MNNDFPPIAFANPEFQKRRPDKPRRAPLPPELLARRGEIAKKLELNVSSLNTLLSKLTNDQRKAIFFKVTHEGTLGKDVFSGTGLKPMVDRSDGVMLVVPKDENLDRLSDKLDKFANEEPKGPGYVPNQDFVRIEAIEKGDPKDRLSDELLADYESLIATKTPSIICEIELLSLQQGPNQQKKEIAQTLQDLKSAFASGVHGTLFEHQTSGPTCRAVIRCTGNIFRQLVEDDRWQWKISWFEPKPRFETFHTVWNQFQFEELGEITAPDQSAPVVCVVDSGISSGNPFLEPVAREDMLKSFLKLDPDNPNDEVGHGSGVASLVSYYGLTLDEGAENPAKVWIASARILDATNQLEENRLFSKVLEEVVETFHPMGVRIFNLSVADLGKKWNLNNKRTQPRTSWTARTIDRLSREYDIVFVTATGNILTGDIIHHLKDGSEFPAYLCDEESRILDPGQAALALSVGSIARGALVAHSSDTPISMDNEPSPFTRTGPGIKRETKPELVDVGGNLVTNVDQTAIRSNMGTSVVMASNQLTPAAALNYGTSFAAPRVSNKLAVVLHDLQELGLERISAPLMKAFLVNSAAYRRDPREIEERLDTGTHKRWLDLVGYGFADASRATECDDYSTVLFYQGEIEADQVAFFDLPVPAELSGADGRKQLTVTLAHYPEVQKWGLESYFGVDLKWRVFRGDIDRDGIIEAMSKMTDDSGEDTEEEDITLPNEVSFEHKVTRRSRGTVQHDSCQWKQHRKAYSENHYTLAIACHKRWPRQVGPTPFGVVVRVEDLGGQVAIYNEIANQIELLAEAQSEL